ncbi:MAG: bifunctional phosphopantothenoylcysteine decarboxylase/phosphopantothenate--cysteine ligase CoaBC [Xanthobacteraceae bacterium]|nr:bifunctional phosphopantothenoylcysteine decarboxylase/phosphopantothenate--cysteine ligase CoaBC [Xanthobacteraceae bacterium]QYK45082.1 MAG: bifunctional phosphopantothenoylcysteine decarboxylase/phosphopantothenate--cysteine ligase CoaBC [Xanthobacteraceae bacterium]
MPLQGKNILLIIAGGIAAYKSLDLIRRLRERGAKVRVIMTRAAQEFVTPLAVGAIAGERPFTELFDLAAEFDIGHIRLAREADLIVVAPATADLMAKMVQGRADDLASTVLLAADRRILLAPAMNPAMWMNTATRRNVERLQADGAAFAGPEAGEMAETGERGVGRMSEPLAIVAAIEKNLFEMPARDALAGKKILVTSGPTREPIDPVRYISNHSSGRQGHALARMAAIAGAEVVLVSGPVALPDPSGVKTIHVETAEQMLNASQGALPADAAIFAAAVADWRVANEAAQKMKKQDGKLPLLSFAENPDILATISRHSNLRPRLVIGFAAETENLIENARAKLMKKGCDWIVANDVSTGTSTFGGGSNEVHLVSATGVESWPMQSKEAVAAGLVKRIAATLGGAA